MSPVFCCGFECGIIGAGTGVGEHWSNNGTSNNSLSTTIKRNGARSLRINPTASTGSVVNLSFSSQTFVIRFYVYFATLPNSDCTIFTTYAVSNRAGLVFKSSNNSLYPGFYNGGVLFGSSGLQITSERWYCIDLKIITSANPWTVDLNIGGVTLTQATQASAALSHTTMNLGVISASTTADIYYDDFICSTTSGDYPIGNGYVNHFVPTSDGTHTATTTTIVKGTIATPVGANVAGSTDVFNWVNGVPLLGGASDNTRLVNQQTAGTTLYAEVVFGPAPNILTPKYAPRAVEVITADREASTATGDFTTKLNDNGTEDSIIARGVVAGVTSDRYARKHYANAPTGGAWTIASGAGNFNNIRARFGYASDANPDQYWRGIMIEAEFAERPQKINQIKQAVNRASTY